MFDSKKYMKKYMKKYYRVNTHKWLEWKQRNRAKLCRLSKEYYRKNRDKILVWRMRYAKLNAKLILVRERARRVRDRLKLRQRRKDYAKSKKYKAWTRRYRARKVHVVLMYQLRKRGAQGFHTLDQWINLKREYGDRCAYCGKIGEMTRDHIVPLSKGGSNDIKNLIPACRSCNSSKKDKTLEVWRTEKRMEGVHVGD